jgi:acetoin:2,6-dichlorophenolindophenol oxidoreductase subunit alpha
MEAMLTRRVRADDAALFATMSEVRAFELASARLWELGLISGEMHLGVGEEAIFAGVMSHLRDGDAIAFDHRAGPPVVARGVDLELLVLEMLGDERGLCRGRGGHMHFLAPDRLAAGTGIVGATAPLACGFALAAEQLHPDSVAVAFFGDGAANQGSLLEAFNLAAAWKLPVVFVCKDNRWAITTRTRTVTGGSLLQRARGLGLRAQRTNGFRAEAVWAAAGEAIARARDGKGPTFLHARCPRPEGHFLGDPLIRLLRQPRREAAAMAPDVAAGLTARPGAPMRLRARALGRTTHTVAQLGVGQLRPGRDPVARMRRRLGERVAAPVERDAHARVEQAVRQALEIAGNGHRG